MTMATPYVALGLFYELNEHMKISAGVMNNGFEGEFAMPNLTKSIYAKFDGEKLFND
jgi:hypothetical protein